MKKTIVILAILLLVFIGIVQAQDCSEALNEEQLGIEIQKFYNGESEYSAFEIIDLIKLCYECNLCNECTTDSDCDGDEKCDTLVTGYNVCIPIECPNGAVVNHKCVGCATHNDCGGDEFCNANNECQKLICGKNRIPQNHNCVDMPAKIEIGFIIAGLIIVAGIGFWLFGFYGLIGGGIIGAILGLLLAYLI